MAMNAMKVGVVRSSIYAEMLPLYERAIDLPSSYTVMAELTENMSSDYQLDISVNNPSGYEDEDLRLFIVLTESHIEESWQILDELNFVARAVYPGSEGFEVSFESGSSATFSQNIIVPSNYVEENCQINVFVQDVSTGEVWQTLTFGFDAVSIEERAGEEAAVVFPNPATNEIFIQASMPMTAISIYNQQGQLVEIKSGKDLDNRVDISRLPDGVYFVKVVTEHQIHTEKVIKK